MNKIYLGNFNISTSKFGSGDTTMYIGANKVYPMDSPAGCTYDVTSNISTYTARTYSEVYDSTQEKWFMRNNLNQYEEYGIYGEGKNITTYQGKLTIDSGHEWQWSGSSWVDLGEVSGGTGFLPAVSFSVNYNATEYDQTTSSLTMTTGQNVEHNPVVSGNPITVNDGYITVTGNSRAVIPSTWKDYFNRGSSNPNLTIVCKAKTISAGGSGGGNIIANRGGNYNWMYRQYSDKLTLHGTSECAPLSITNDGQPKICSIRVNSSRDVILNNWSEETTSTVSNFSYGSSNSDGCALFCGYSTTTNEYWNGDFYWVYVSQETLTDAQIEDVIDYNENGGIDIPVEYSDIAAPPTSVTFQSVAEMEDYVCAYDGLIGFVGTDAYIYTRADGWQIAPPTDKPYLTFVATEAGTFKLSGNSIDYSINGGISWSTLASNTDSPTVPAGGTIMFRATLTPSYINGIGKFYSTGRFTASGNPMCLLFGDDFENKTSLSGKSYAFQGLFYGCTGLTSAENMSLPATTLANDCYNSMFNGCTRLTTAPSLPATTLASYCYNGMFYGCTSLTTAPALPATTLASYCYNVMFSDCTSLTAAPELSATTLASSCYRSMFQGCTRLTTAPSLPATTLANDCYNGMFQHCTFLTAAPELSATTLASSCYRSMFYNCISLTTAPSLPATTLANDCYNSMFNGCTRLTTAPVLPASALTNSCYAYMFNGCTSLTTVPSLPATTLAGSCYSNMFHGCTSLTTAPSLPATTLANYCYDGMFNGCTRLTAAPVLSSTTLAGYCYSDMFANCSSLTTAPELPATTMVVNCYHDMFYNCTSLTTAPVLSATTLAVHCYSSMFSGCRTLTTAPALPATALTESCYSGMFSNCTSLTTAPVLSATTSANYCYQYMFSGCRTLTTAPALPATALTESCYYGMFYGCTSLTTAPALPATTLASNCYNVMFYGCTSLTTAPSVLPATTLASYCYNSMFNGCTRLTAAPVLPATTLVNNCYYYMFRSCTSLNSITCLATDISASNCTYQWVVNIAANGTFTKDPSMTSWTTGYNGIPTNWTVQDAS